MAGGGIAGRLYRGELSVNIVHRQRRWYAISGLILLVSVIALLTRGLNFSQEFTGGSSFTFPASSSMSQGAISRVVTAAGGVDATVQNTSSRSLGQEWTVQTGTLTADTGGGNLSATGLTSPTANVNGEGGSITLGFSTAPTTVQVDTGGGNASLSVPGGPYAITTDTGGSQESVLIGNTPGASSVINVSTEGGELQIGPA